MGFGFVNYRDNESARRAIEAVNGREIECDASEGDNGIKHIKVCNQSASNRQSTEESLVLALLPGVRWETCMEGQYPF